MLPVIGMTNHREAIIALAAHHRVPAVYPFRYFAASGGLMSYGTDVTEVFRRNRLCRPYPEGYQSGRASDSGSNQVRLVINLKTAKALGLTVPPTLLARADEVIE